MRFARQYFSQFGEGGAVLGAQLGDLARLENVVHGFDDATSRGGQEDMLDVVVAGGSVAEDVIGRDFGHVSYALADARLGAGERAVVGAAVGVDSGLGNELVEAAVDGARFGAGQQLEAHGDDVGVLTEEGPQAVRGLAVAVDLAGEGQKRRDVTMTFGGGDGRRGIFCDFCSNLVRSGRGHGDTSFLRGAHNKITQYYCVIAGLILAKI